MTTKQQQERDNYIDFWCKCSNKTIEEFFELEFFYGTELVKQNDLPNDILKKQAFWNWFRIDFIKALKKNDSNNLYFPNAHKKITAIIKKTELANI
jgi:hypothetical protein